jgi:hypothetical protein
MRQYHLTLEGMMIEKTEKAFAMAGELKKLVSEMIGEAVSLDLKRLLKQVDADLMDIQHKLFEAIKISQNEV